MTNILLQPDEVRHWQANLEDLANPLALATSANIARLLADYLTLWETLEAMNDQTEGMLTTFLAAFEEAAAEQREGLERFRLFRSLNLRKTCCCRSRPYVCCPVHGPVECFDCGSRMARCHAEGCNSAVEPDDGTPTERES